MKFYSRWPTRILFSASRLLYVYQTSNSPFCDRREKERKKERENGQEKERTCLCNRYMKHRDRGTPRRESRYVFSESACTLFEHTLASSRASVCTRYLSSAAVYRLILLFHSSKFKHFTLAIPRFVFSSPRDDAEPDDSIGGVCHSSEESLEVVKFKQTYLPNITSLKKYLNKNNYLQERVFL